MIQPVEPSVTLQNSPFFIGQYRFDPDKNELAGFGETILLNRKENCILRSLCIKQGNVVERSQLLDENWGSLGAVYSRSLDTYLTTLRKYLRKDPSIQIITVKGVGYKLVSSCRVSKTP
jgi:DNA-binding response OmpR family regulator